QSPAPAGQTQGKITEREYDSIGRLLKDKIANYGGAYTRYEYPANGVQSKVFSTIIDTNSNGIADTSDEVFSESWADGAGRVRMSRTEHPGSAGGWAATIAEYDILGRVARTSVPTEISVSGTTWTPAGDDATRGFLWTHQKYDWMGRVIRKINTDGTDSPTLNDSDLLISYDGCGCAGGLVTTIDGELVPRTDTSGNARRKQKSYADILGRTWKTETYEWNGTTVYSTVTSQFNGRDQVVESRQYAGSTSSQTYQDTTATFDGHGRLKTSHRPEQRDGSNNPLSTTYNYNTDDSISSVVDARGAVTSYTYENNSGTPLRPLVTGIAWTVPGGSGIEDPADVSFTFDNLGNRTQMTDGLGTINYSYSPLSQLTSETRIFTETLPNKPTGNFNISYEYTIGGALKSYSDPYGEEIEYAFDKRGRLDEVTGTSFGGVTSYANNPGYRAWGALKHLEYSNGYEMDIEFDNRLRASEFLVQNATPTKIFDRSYEYYADGRLKLADESVWNRFDRSFTWDHQGRVKDAKSGAEAHGGTETNLNNLPYRQTYSYDQFQNTTSRSSTLWNYGSWEFSYSIVNNRVAGSQYDFDGRQTGGDGATFNYNAPGRMISTAKEESYETVLSADGLGRETKRSNRTWDEVEEEWTDWESTYFVHSSVLGRLLTEVDDTGKKRRAFVIAGGSEIARQAFNDEDEEVVSFIHRDAAGLSGRATQGGTEPLFNTNAYLAEERDGLGNNVGIFGDLSRPPHEGGSMQSPNDSITFDRVDIGDCELDGIATPCSLLGSIGEALQWQIRRHNERTGFTYQHVDVDRSLPGNHPVSFWVSNTQTAVTSVRNPNDPDDRGEAYYQTFKDGQWISLDLSWAPQRQTQRLAPLTPEKDTAFQNALDELIGRLRDGNFSEDCKKNVLDKLKTLTGFSAEAFANFLAKGADLYDGEKSTALVSDFDPNGKWTITTAKRFENTPGLHAFVGIGSNATRLTIFFDPDFIETKEKISSLSGQKVSGLTTSNLAFAFHEALHGFGNSLGSFDENNSVFGDTKLKELFGLTGNGSKVISDHIEKNCFK
ncbi:MAG: RHS repeat domain-containing protein, partial [Blastocatellia bacterium]